MNTSNEIPKKKHPKKEVRIIKRKPIVVFGLVTVVAIAGIIVGITIFTEIPEEKILYASYSGAAMGIDPLETWAPTDYEIISQVAEGLFTHDIASEQSRVIHNLAINHTWNANYTELTCGLRQGVQFHDGTTFNAAAVQWNIKRIYTLIDNGEMHWTKAQFWIFPDGNRTHYEQRIINKTEINGDYNIKFILNKPYVPLIALLASHSAFMLSPTSTPSDDFIDRVTEKIIGTGPFKYDSAVFIYIPAQMFYINVETTFSSNPNYWGGKPQIDKLIFKYYPTTEARYNALLSGEVSVLSGFTELLMDTDWIINIYYDKDILDTLINHPDIIVEEGPPATAFAYLIMNNELINVTMRKSISYAFNYSAFIDQWLNGHGTRLKSPLPAGILYSNSTDIHSPYYNISIARQTLKDVNWNGLAGALPADDNVSAGNKWEKLVDDGTPLAIYNYTTIPSPFSDTLLAILTENLKQIGIKVVDANVTIGEYFFIFMEVPPYHLNMVELGWMNYVPSFNDPSSILNILCSNKSLDLNYCQVNDPILQELMEDALKETNATMREQSYYQIQKRIIEEVFPMCYLYSKHHFNIYRSNVMGLQFNLFTSTYKDVYFI
ncbi:MAG: ABC transporter substrate-binding protein [Candidatus Thorarchaeota archaeon]